MKSTDFKKGDILDILNDNVSDKAPCTCTIVGVKSKYLIVEHSDCDEYIEHTRFDDYEITTVKRVFNRRHHTVK